MSPNDRAIEDQMFQVRLSGTMLVQLMPDPFVTPAGKAFVNRVPGAVLFRQQAPLRPAAGDPEDTFDKKAALVFIAHINLTTGA